MLEAWLAYFSIASAFLVYDLAANEKILAVGYKSAYRTCKGQKLMADDSNDPAPPAPPISGGALLAAATERFAFVRTYGRISGFATRLERTPTTVLC